MTEDEMVKWSHGLDGHEFEPTPRDRDEEEKRERGNVALALSGAWDHNSLLDTPLHSREKKSSSTHQNSVEPDILECEVKWP